MFAASVVSVFKADIKIKNSIFRKSLFSALDLIEANTEIENTIFEDNENTALSIQGGATKIINSCFKNNQLGLKSLQASKIQLENNNFLENETPISINLASQLSFSGNQGNQFNNNFLNGVLIDLTDSDTLSNSVVLPVSPFPYVFEQTLFIDEQGMLVLKPGTVIKTLSASPLFEVKGNLNAQGTEERTVIITPLKDDQELGDTNNDGENSQPAVGDWQGIKIFGKADLKNLKLRYTKENPLDIHADAEVIQENVFMEP